MLSFIPIVALATFASAVPHGHKHLHIHAPRIVAHHLAKAAPLAGRDELPVNLMTGECGGDTGFGCETGYCCSEWGYCGVTPDYCGVGCQFGSCNGNSTSPVPAPANPPPVVSVANTEEPASSSTSRLANKGHSILPHGGPTFHPQAPTTLAIQVSIALPTTTPNSNPEPSPVTTEAPASTSVVEAPSSTSIAAPSSASVAAPSSTPPSSGGGGGAGFGDKYVMYTGNGMTSSGWPSQSDWMSFDDAWETNMQDISISCAQFNVDNNSDEESANLKQAILTVGSESGIDSRFILAIVMQESKGCVRAPTTAYSVKNPGLMQSHNGPGTCNPGTAASPQGVSPCPMSEITQMIRDGTTGTLDVSGGGDGLQQTLEQAATNDVSRYYKAARIYNSGSVTDDNLGLGVATHCYASDVANRLTGWVTAPLLCTLDG